MTTHDQHTEQSDFSDEAQPVTARCPAGDRAHCTDGACGPLNRTDRIVTAAE